MDIIHFPAVRMQHTEMWHGAGIQCARWQSLFHASLRILPQTFQFNWDTDGANCVWWGFAMTLRTTSPYMSLSLASALEETGSFVLSE